MLIKGCVVGLIYLAILFTMGGSGCGGESEMVMDESTCEDTICPTGQSCQEFESGPACVDDSTESGCNPPCTNDEICNNGTCEDNTPEPSPEGEVCNPSCQFNQFCEAGECQDFPIGI